MAAKSSLRVECVNGEGTWNFPYQLNAAKISTIAPLTLGVVKSNILTTETAYTDTVTEPEGDENTGIKQRKAVCVFKYTPTDGDPQLHRISIPAPVIGDTGLYAVADGNGLMIPAAMTGAGSDGNDLAALFKSAMDLTGTMAFVSGVVVTVRHHG